MIEQFLTAVFELRPTRRKAAVLEYVRATSERVFWETMAEVQAAADAAVRLDPKERRAASSRLGSHAIVAASKAGLSEPVAQGIARDLCSAASAYIEARAKGREASWPQREEAQPLAPLGDRLDAFAVAATLETETVARDALNAREPRPKARPIMLARSRDCRIVRDDKGRLAVTLNILRASDPRAVESTINAGSDASTGEVLKGQARKTVVVVPLSCSLWHEGKFLSGRTRLCSGLVYPRNGRWWFQAQFAAAVEPVQPTGAVIGIDRGVVNPVALAVVAQDGAVMDVPGRRGADLSQAVTARGEMMRRQQRGGSEKFRRSLGRAAGATRSAGESKARTRVGRRIDQGLHVLANEIVDLAQTHQAHVAVERLDGLKSAIGEKRAKGARRGGWGTVLRKAQLAKLESLLAYKLPLAGLPPLREILAAGTSRTCPACGHVDPKSRPDQATFKCTGCGLEHNADDNAAVIIARRGTFEIRKGVKLDALHRDMVGRLRSRDDGGLGPLASRRRVVAAHATADRPNASESSQEPEGPNLTVGQNSNPNAAENPPGYERQSARSGINPVETATRRFARKRGKVEPRQGVLL